MCPNTEFSWSAFSRIWTEYGVIRSISLYSVRMRENYGPEKTPYLDTFHTETKTFFKKLKHWFLGENTKNRNTTLPYKTALLETGWEVGNGTITRSGVFHVAILLLRTLSQYKNLLWRVDFIYQITQMSIFACVWVFLSSLVIALNHFCYPL